MIQVYPTHKESQMYGSAFSRPIPAHMLDSLKQWAVGNHPYPTGGFLHAILTNNLKAACERADNINIELLPAYTSWCFNNMPRQAWGSEANYNSWLARMCRHIVYRNRETVPDTDITQAQRDAFCELAEKHRLTWPLVVSNGGPGMDKVLLLEIDGVAYGVEADGHVHT